MTKTTCDIKAWDICYLVFYRKSLSTPGWELCCGLNCAPPKNSCAEALSRSVAVFGDGACGKYLDLDEVVRVGSSWGDWCPYKKRTPESSPLSSLPGKTWCSHFCCLSRQSPQSPFYFGSQSRLKTNILFRDLPRTNSTPQLLNFTKISSLHKWRGY